MRYSILLLLLSGLFSAVSAQSRQENVEKFNGLKNQAKILEKSILSPDKRDTEIALRENLGVFRLVPRETYDKGLFFIKGGGAYYSFYFRIPDWGYGSDIGLEQNYLQTGHTGCGLMTDLGEISLGEVTKEISGAVSLANYQNAKDISSCRSDYYLAYRDGLKLDETIFKPRLPAIAGHTYLVRSIVHDYYDILAAFQIRRIDTDGSLVIFWKQLEQFETPHRTSSQQKQVGDAEILRSIKGWTRAEEFSSIKAEVNEGVVTLRGKVAKDRLAHAIQLANDAGATKVINLLAIE